MILTSVVLPSGGGKTTLVKIMLGLLEPTSGEVLIDGVPLPTFGARAYREQVGAVMQAWYPGSGGGDAITRLLYGDVAPSGRLPLSWPKDDAQLVRATIQGAGLNSKEKPADTAYGGATLLPASETTRKEPEFEPSEKQRDDLNVDAVFAKLKTIGGKKPDQE